MRPVLVVELGVCGVLIAGLTLLARHLQPDLPRLTFFTGLAGGILCVLWAGLGRRTTHCRLGSMVTLGAVACVLLIQGVQSWKTSAAGGLIGRTVALLRTVLVAFCLDIMANLARERKGPRP